MQNSLVRVSQLSEEPAASIIINTNNDDDDDDDGVRHFIIITVHVADSMASHLRKWLFLYNT